MQTDPVPTGQVLARIGPAAAVHSANRAASLGQLALVGPRVVPIFRGPMHRVLTGLVPVGLVAPTDVLASVQLRVLLKEVLLAARPLVAAIVASVAVMLWANRRVTALLQVRVVLRAAQELAKVVSKTTCEPCVTCSSETSNVAAALRWNRAHCRSGHNLPPGLLLVMIQDVAAAQV